MQSMKNKKKSIGPRVDTSSDDNGGSCEGLVRTDAEQGTGDTGLWCVCSVDNGLNCVCMVVCVVCLRRRVCVCMCAGGCMCVSVCLIVVWALLWQGGFRGVDARTLEREQ